MFVQSRSANNSSYRKRIRNYTQGNFEFNKNKEQKLCNDFNKLNNTPKVEFRKVLKLRNKNSRVGQLDELSQQSIISNRSSRYFQRTLLEDNIIKTNQQENSPNKKLSFKNLSFLNKQKSQQKNDTEYRQKLHLDERLKQSKQENSPKETSRKSLISNLQNKIQDFNEKQLRTNISLPKKDLLNSARSNKSLIRKNQKQKPINKQDKLLKQQQTANDIKLRPKSSISNFSPIQHLSNKERNISQLSFIENEKEKIIQRKQIQSKSNQVDNVIEKFLYLESKIIKLTQEKWKLIEQKLLKQKQKTRIFKSNSRLDTKSVSIPLQTFNTKKLIAQKQNQKFSFSAQAQTNIDNQIMNQIKSLRNLNLQSLQNNKDENKDLPKILQQMQNRRALIIQKALAQSMVESQLLKKYYSGQNAKALSTSNHKVGQMNLKNKIIQANIKKLKTQQKIKIDLQQQKISQKTQSLPKQSQSKRNFVPPSLQDYEKYRYKHPDFRPNLQPLPRSTYKSQFFNYSNVQIFNQRFKQRGNMVFPTTSALKSSSYQNQYRQFSPERINYKQLDAYKDKFKQIDVIYMPKKRSQSQAYTTRKGSKPNKYFNQLDFVKRLKTQSLLGSSFDKQTTQRLASKFFATETKNQYQNPQKLSYQFDKSEIKHKKLYMLKYDMKKKFCI